MIKQNILFRAYFFAMAYMILLTACTVNEKKNRQPDIPLADTSNYTNTSVTDTTVADSNLITVQPNPFDSPKNRIDVKNIKPYQIVAFAKTLIGVPYKYASTNPAEGFDCSGFITYVFNHFNIAVPRSSVDFTNVPVQIIEKEAKPGDLILFTGTDSTVKIIGHMGIVIENSSSGIQFIHSSSGKANGVTVSSLEGYYRGRFVKLIRLFE